MLKVSNLSFQLKNGKYLINDISLSLAKGEICSIIGPNGAGKTSLVKTISGLNTPSAGEILFGGQNLLSMSLKDRAKLIAYLPQRQSPVSCRVIDAVILGRRPYLSWHPSKADYEIAHDILFELDLLPFKDSCIRSLSGGELQKVLIARALVQKSPILILDEPVNHLDIKNQMETLKLIQRITRQYNIATLVVLHDLAFALRFSDTVLLIQNGRRFFYGPAETLTEKVLSEVYKIPISVQKIAGEKRVFY